MSWGAKIDCPPRAFASSSVSQCGLTLVELMIAMAIGLIMVSVVAMAFVSNSAATRTLLATAQLQESARFALDYLARDVREAGSFPCGNQTELANVLTSASANGGSIDWANFDTPVSGYEDSEAVTDIDSFTGFGRRVAGTDALRLVVSTGNHYSIREHNTVAAQFQLNDGSHSVGAGDILLACDYEQTTIFQASSIGVGSADIAHISGTGSPGNCTTGLGSPVTCTSTGTPYRFEEDGVIVAIRPAYWYVGCNDRADCDTAAGRSLFFTYLSGATLMPQDVIDGVMDFQLTYLQQAENSYQTASVIPADDWENVVGIHVLLNLLEANVGVGNEGSDIERNVDFVIAVRGRL